MVPCGTCNKEKCVKEGYNKIAHWVEAATPCKVIHCGATDNRLIPPCATHISLRNFKGCSLCVWGGGWLFSLVAGANSTSVWPEAV